MKRLLMTGAGGLLGSALRARLHTSGIEVVALKRSSGGAADPVGPDVLRWDPARGTIDGAALSGFDAVIHLAGESIGATRWTPAVKRRIWESRTAGTRLLAERLAHLAQPPGVWISASALGYYGDRGAEELNEEAAPGRGFLATVCREWEAATAPASEAGLRVVRLRTGLVLTPRGGALPRMLPPFRLGLGGRLGSGRQYWSWITLEDWVEAVLWILHTPNLEGAVNLCAPKAATNAEFTRALGRALRRPTPFPVPAVLLSILFGEFAREGLLAGQRAVPAKLLDSGFAFRHAALDEALRHALSRQ